MKRSVFSAVTAFTPWWLAKKVFWKNSKKVNTDEKFNNMSRRNSKVKIKIKDERLNEIQSNNYTPNPSSAF